MLTITHAHQFGVDVYKTDTASQADRKIAELIITWINPGWKPYLRCPEIKSKKEIINFLLNKNITDAKAIYEKESNERFYINHSDPVTTHPPTWNNLKKQLKEIL